MLRKINPQFASLDDVKSYVESKNTDFTYSIQVDQWVETFVQASNKCVVIKKSATAGAKIVMVEPGVIDVVPIAPSTFFNSFRRGIGAIVLDLIIAGGQNKVANEVDGWMKEIEH